MEDTKPERMETISEDTNKNVTEKGQEEEGGNKKRKWDGNRAVDFIVNPKVYDTDYANSIIPYDDKKPRAMPFPDGKWAGNEYVVVSGNGKKVTFDMQEGSTNDGQNGTYPDALIQYTVALLEEKNQGALRNRETSCAITHLQEALHWLLQRSIERKARGVQGSRNP